MPTHLASLDSLVHPHQMEIQEFASYALVIDARSARAYQEDHLHGAVSVPVATVPPHPVRESPAIGAAAPGADETGPSMPSALAAHTQRLSAGDAVLVYCDRGGLDSMVWAAPLRAAGFRVDVLGGGWINYRRWVSAGLELLPRVLSFRPLIAPPVSGLCRVLDVLARRGEQVLDLAAMAGQDLVPGLTLQGDEQPSQAAFETALLDAMRRLNPQRPVWIRDGIAGLGGLALPPALRDALRRSKSVTLEVPLQVRALAWFERLQAMNTPMTFLLEAFSASPSPPTSQTLEQWRSLANADQITDALAAIIRGYIDPRCEGVPVSARVEVIHLASLKTDAVGAAVNAWLGRNSSVFLNGTT